LKCGGWKDIGDIRICSLSKRQLLKLGGISRAVNIIIKKKIKINVSVMFVMIILKETELTDFNICGSEHHAL